MTPNFSHRVKPRGEAMYNTEQGHTEFTISHGEFELFGSRQLEN